VWLNEAWIRSRIFAVGLASWHTSVYTAGVAIDLVPISPQRVARKDEAVWRLLPKLPEPTAPETSLRMGDYPFGRR
jgi:hypothetical protein